ncbi:unnamed protein product [Clavelina lepadiformis]|uniref:CFA20 domain-containing protein n=1 Tax=Clavelina lepadiformis TaxID=159417 RepID=A0ABP0FSS6_CLALP
MFKNEYQGGPYVEVFSAGGKDPLANVRNVAAKRVYDKEVKGFIYYLEGSTTTSKLNFPIKDSKQSLCLIQRYLVTQVFVPISKDFAIELMMTDVGGNKRRVVLSTSVREISATPLHAKLPLSFVKRDSWVNLCFDLVSILSDAFPGQTFNNLDCFSISGNCRFRRVFTLKCQPFDTTLSSDDEEINNFHIETIPSNLQFATSLSFATQVISVGKIRTHLGLKTQRSETRETSGYWSSSSEDLSHSRRMSARDHPRQIAFGTKVPLESTRSIRGKNGPSSARLERVHDSSDMLTNRGSLRQTHSSKARLLSHHDMKENYDPSQKSTFKSSLKQRETKRVVKSLKNISTHRFTEQGHSSGDVNDDVTTMLNEELKFYPDQVDEGPPVDGGSVFRFTSHPHTLPRIRTDSGSKKEEIEEDSSTDDEDKILQRIIRKTPSPRRSSNPLLKVSRGFNEVDKDVKQLMQPQSSLSPDISRLSSSPAYDSSRYTDASLTNKNFTRPPVNRSIISLRSSDATLTASVDTLVQSSINEPQSDDRTSNISQKNLLESDLSPPQSENFDGSQTSVLLSRRSVREIPPVIKFPESNGFQVGNESLEAQVLADMKLGMEEDEVLDDPKRRMEEKVNYQDHFNDSLEISWSTYHHPPPMQPQAYEAEMQRNDPSSQANRALDGLLLDHSNPRDWANLLSPPMILPSTRTQQKKESYSDVESGGNESDSMGLSDGSSLVSIKSSNGAETDEEEMLDLMYDPCLNCYFDPKSGKYYELKN